MARWLGRGRGRRLVSERGREADGAPETASNQVGAGDGLSDLREALRPAREIPEPDDDERGRGPGQPADPDRAGGGDGPPHGRDGDDVRRMRF